MGEHTGSPLQKTAGRQAEGPPTEALRRAGRSCGKFYRRNDQTFYRLKAALRAVDFSFRIPHLCADLPSPTEAGFAKAGARSDAQAQSALRIYLSAQYPIIL